jgi:hypothetical protein
LAWPQYSIGLGLRRDSHYTQRRLGEFARRLKFAGDLHSSVIVSAGADALGLPVVIDGLNEKGVAVGIFPFPGYAECQEVKAEERDKALAAREFDLASRRLVYRRAQRIGE